MNTRNYTKLTKNVSGLFAVLLLSLSLLSLISAGIQNAHGATLRTDKFKVYGLVCGDTFCVTSIQNALTKIKGVISAHVDMKKQEAIVKFHGNISPKVFIKAIDGASNAIFHYKAHYIK